MNKKNLALVKSVMHLMQDEKSIKAVEVAELYLSCKATQQEVRIAYNNAFLYANELYKHEVFKNGANNSVYRLAYEK